jgi:glycosyltransferase involved in cell wall biosynthesis
MSDKIAIFYHVSQTGAWKEKFLEHVIKLQQIGLYDAADYIHIGVNGSYRMPFNLDNVDVVKRNKDFESQSETLQDLQQFCSDNPNHKILYFHSNSSLQFNENWWKNSLIELESTDIIQSEDFWLANSSYINKVKDMAIYELHKSLKAKLGMISMFKNEAKNIRAMLDSVTPHISYWVLQDNGSTDGTPGIVNQWAQETKIPGFMYKVDEGWVGFGWNRDHVLQKFLSSNHNCQWLMKMDCDETLVIDSDFDWEVFNRNLETHAFHVQAEAPSIVYYRAWLWNTKYPWKFNHDPAHETIALDIEGIGEEFQRVNLPSSFKMVAGESYGESYTVPTKYLSDALKLEERMMRENILLTDSYHFWYIGKSYSDAYVNADLPLGKIHQDEYARRSIFYFKQYVNHLHDYENTKQPKYIDEMSYFALNCVGNAYRFIGDIENCIKTLKEAEAFCPKRNEHLVSLVQVYDQIEQYDKMLECTERLIDPERVCPFPEFIFIITTYIYNDKSTYPAYLHNLAVSKLESKLNL